jgi:hypothetical protein
MPTTRVARGLATLLHGFTACWSVGVGTVILSAQKHHHRCLNYVSAAGGHQTKISIGLKADSEELVITKTNSLK